MEEPNLTQMPQENEAQRAANEETPSARFRKVIDWLLYNNYVQTRKELASRIGYAETTLSSVINDRYPLTRSLVEGLSVLEAPINLNWIFDGQGNMVNIEEQRNEEESKHMAAALSKQQDIIRRLQDAFNDAMSKGNEAMAMRLLDQMDTQAAILKVMAEGSQVKRDNAPTIKSFSDNTDSLNGTVVGDSNTNVGTGIKSYGKRGRKKKNASPDDK